MPPLGRQQKKNEIDALSIESPKVDRPEKTCEQANHGLEVRELRMRNGNATVHSRAPLSFPREQGTRYRLGVQAIDGARPGGDLMEERLLGARLHCGEDRLARNNVGNIHE